MNENPNSGAVELYKQMGDPMIAAVKMGDFLTKSNMFGCGKSEQGIIIALTCMMEGISLVEFNRTYHIINDKLAMRADAMLAKFNARGGKHKIIEYSPDRAAVELTIDGQSTAFELTWKDAQLEPFAKTGKGEIAFNYSTPLKRSQMMWARVTSRGVRAMAPGIVAGFYTEEEVQDFNTDSRAPKEAILKDAKTEVVSTPPAAQPAKPTKPESAIIDVVAEPAKPAAPTPASTPPPTPTPEPAKVAAVVTPPATAVEATTATAPIIRVSKEEFTKLQAVIGEKHWDAAAKHLTAKKVMDNENWWTLRKNWTEMIIANPNGFFRSWGVAR